jgi:hypothetical protein
MAQADFIVKNGAVILNGLTATSTSTTTGALVVQGGIATSDRSTFGGPLFITNTSQSISSTTGALIVTGGVGIQGDLIVQDVNLLKYDDTVYYVSDGTGNDDNDGRRVQSAFKTIKHALSVAQPNSTVYIESGTYTEEFPLTVPVGVSVKGAGLRDVFVQPTTATNTSSAFLLNGETTISDFTVGNFYKPGFAFEYAPGMKITTRSPYVQRFSVITRGSNPTSGDPYGFDSNDAGGGAKLDGALVDATSLEAAFLFNEATFITPSSTAVYMTNGSRIELLNGFSYFADKGIVAESGSVGWGGQGRTRLRLANSTGTFTVGHNLYYVGSTGTVLASGLIDEVTSEYVYLDGKASGFVEAQDRTGKSINVFGNTQISSFQRKFGTGAAHFTTDGDLLDIVSDADLQYGFSSYTVEAWIYLDQNSRNQYIVNKGSTAATTLGLYIGSDNKLVGQHGTTLLTATSVLSTGTWYHVMMSRDLSNTNRLFVNGSLESTTTATASISNADSLTIGGVSGTPSLSLRGYIDELRISTTARYTGSFTPPTSAYASDISTTILLHCDGADTSVSFTDDGLGSQNVYSTAGEFDDEVVATAQQISLADYRQFGAEMRSIGSAVCYGNYGIYTDGEGIDLKAIAFNMSYIGSGKDFTNDPALAIQANEIVRLNGAKVYFQTVDHLGDFRVGPEFRINQRTGNVDFGTANFRLGPLSSLTISDGVNTSVLQPTSIQVGQLLFSGSRVQTISGNLTIDPAGSLTTIESNLQVNGSLNFTDQLLATGMDNAVSTTTGAIVVNGGIGVGKDIYVGGNATVVGNLVVKGATTIVNSTQTSITDPVLDLGTNPDRTDIVVNDGFDRGLLFHYNTAAGTSTYTRSFFGMDNASQALIYKTGVATGTNEEITPSFITSGAWGAAKFGTLRLESLTNSSGGNSGALQVAGGGWFAKDVYGDRFFDVTGRLISVNTIPLYAVTTLTAGTDTVVSTSTGAVTIWNNSTLGTVTSRGSTTTAQINITNQTESTSTDTGALIVTGGVGIGGDLNARNVYSNGFLVVTEGTIGALGVTALYAGTDTEVSTSTGVVTVWNKSTLQSITDRGFTTSNRINVTNNTASTSTTTGALTVSGGIGATGDIYAKDIYSNGVKTLTTETDTLQSVTSRGNVTDIRVLFDNTSQATVSGFESAVGITGGLHVGKKIYGLESATIGSGALDSRAILNVNGDFRLQSWDSTSGGTVDLLFTDTHFSFLPINGQALAIGPNEAVYIATGSPGLNFVGINTSSPSVHLEVIGDIKANNIFSNGSQVITNASLAGYGVTSITTSSGGGIHVTTSTGDVVISSLDTLQSVVDRGNEVSTQVKFTSLEPATSPTTAAVIINGGLAIENNIWVGQSATLNTTTVYGAFYVTTTTNSDSTTTGAAVISGGLGVGGNIYAGDIYDNGWRVVTHVNASGGTGISVRDEISNGTSTSFTIDNTGVIAAVGSQYIGVSSATGIVTFTNLGVQTLTAGTDTSVSRTTGTVVVWNTSTLQSVTDRGSITTNALQINNATNSTGTTNGALVVTGGVGIGANLNVNGNANIYGNLQVFGQQTFVNSTQTFIVDPIIEIGSGPDRTQLSVNDGYDRGLVLYYNNTTTPNLSYSNHAFIGMDNATNTFVYKTDIYPGVSASSVQTFANTGTWGLAKFGGVSLVRGTSSTNTVTGDLTIVGGAGIGGTVYIGEKLFVGGFEVLTSGTGGEGSYVSTLEAGTDTAVSNATGAVVVWSTATLQSITNRSSTTTNRITFANTGNSTSTVSGNSVQVSGGVGVAGDVFVQGNIYSQGGAPLYTPRVTVSTTPPNPATNRIGDFWIDPSIGVEYQWIKDGSNFYWIQFTGAL